MDAAGRATGKSHPGSYALISLPASLPTPAGAPRRQTMAGYFPVANRHLAPAAAPAAVSPHANSDGQEAPHSPSNAHPHHDASCKIAALDALAPGQRG